MTNVLPARCPILGCLNAPRVVFSHQPGKAQFIQPAFLACSELAHVDSDRISIQFDWPDGDPAQVEQRQARIGAESAHLVMPPLANRHVDASEPPAVGHEHRSGQAGGARDGGHAPCGKPLALPCDARAVGTVKQHMLCRKDGIVEASVVHDSVGAVGRDCPSVPLETKRGAERGDARRIRLMLATEQQRVPLGERITSLMSCVLQTSSRSLATSAVSMPSRRASS